MKDFTFCAICNLGIVSKLYPEKDGVIRAVKLKTGILYVERPLQYLYSLELHCNVKKESYIKKSFTACRTKNSSQNIKPKVLQI